MKEHKSLMERGTEFKTNVSSSEVLWLGPPSPFGSERITASHLPKELGRNNCEESWVWVEKKPSIARFSPDLCLYLEHCTVFGKSISSGAEHLPHLVCSLENLSLPLATVQTSQCDLLDGFPTISITLLVADSPPSFQSVREWLKYKEIVSVTTKKVFH